MRHVLSILCAGLMLAIGAGAAAQTPDCDDDRGRPRCTAAAIAEQDRLFGLPTIAMLAQSGTAVRRAVFVDGYGRDLLAISFLRPRGGDMLVEIRAPGRGSQPPAVASSAHAPALWQEITERSEHFDRTLAPQQSGGDDNFSICLHSWIMRVEVHDPVRQAANIAGQQREPASTRAAVEDSCQNGLVVAYAFALAQHALQAMPVCQLVSNQRQRNDVTRLADCLRLTGDRTAAARAMNRASEISFLRGHSARNVDLSGLFAQSGRMVIAGQERPQDWSGTDFGEWLAQFWMARLNFGNFHGVSPDDVDSPGTLHVQRTEGGREEIANVRIRWTQELGRAVIADLVIDNFRPSRPED